MNLSRELDPWNTVQSVARWLGADAIARSVDGLTFSVIREMAENVTMDAYTDAGTGFGIRGLAFEAAEAIVSATDLDMMGRQP